MDIGDVSPANREFLLRSLNSGAQVRKIITYTHELVPLPVLTTSPSSCQGVQVDFDDGHCPTWTNTLLGHFNIIEATRGSLAVPAKGLALARDPALLLVRPRAWNMDEMVRRLIVW